MRRLLLADFDPQAVAEHDITADDLRRVERYLWLLQGPDALTLRDIAIGGYYGTSALLHEVVELDILLEREPRLLEMDQEGALDFWHANEDAHATALAAEYGYLQGWIQRLFGEHVDIGALVWANAGKYDFYVLVESDVRIPVFKPKPQQIRRARMLLALLKKTGQEAKR